MAGVGRLLAVAAVSVCMGCFGTGGRAVPVFLPDEQIGCLFEVLGTVTVRGPFPTTNNGGDTSAMMDAVRSKLGIEAARADADAAIDHCDLTKVRYTWSEETWAESAARVIARARDQISGILDLYGVHLSAHFIEILDEIRDDPFLSHVETLGEQLRVGRELFPDEIDAEDYAITRTSAVRGKFIRTLVQAIQLYNEAAIDEAPIHEIPEGFWSQDSGPRPGALRAGEERS